MRNAAYLLPLTLLAGFALAQAPPPSNADGPPDEPGRQVARLSILSGDAQVKRGDTGEWVAAAVNTPLMMGDSLAVGNNGRAEIQFDNSNFVRVASDTEIRLWNLEDNRVQIQVGRGMVTWRVLRAGGMQAEISTQLAAVRPVGLPSVRVEVAPDGATRVTPRNGEADVATQHTTDRVREGNTLLVEGQGDNPQHRTMAAGGRDGWDQFNEQRDSFLTRAQSPRYTSPDVMGTEDLDSYGRWMEDPAYGSVWSPNVSSSWAPYRDGRWVWQDYYGWTWVDDASWGWAPFHYGSWYYRVGYGWNWFPGGRDRRYFYRPALVAFFGGGGYNAGIGFGHVGWVALAPFETYQPWYGRGGWGGGGNNNVTIINNTNIYNTFRNSRSYNGVTAVSGGDFQRGNYRRPVNLNPGQLENSSLVRGGGPVTPTENNLQYSDRGRGRGRQDRDNIAGPRSGQPYFSKIGAPQTEGTRVPFAEQQAAVRSGLDASGGGLGQGTRPDGNRGGFGSRGDRGDSPGFRTAPPSATAPRQNPNAQPGNDARGGGQSNDARGGGQSNDARGGEPGNDSRNGGLGQGSRPDGNRGGFGSRGDRGDSPGFRTAPPSATAPQQNPNAQPGNDRPAWQRFGAPDPVDRGQGNRIERQRTDQDGFGRQRDRNGATSEPRPLDVAPPVVRQREAEPGFNRRGGFGAPAQPQQQQERQQQERQQQAPQQQERQRQERQPPSVFRGGGADRPSGGDGGRRSDGPGFTPPADGGGARQHSGGDGGRQARPEGGRGRPQF